jgi:S-DNA-T family DNA segregation ATPase FtsK/SpoIIIE
MAFRVEERRDVDLILGQGMLSAGWHAHKLNAPGKFLLSSPEHDTPRRARAYLLTDDDVTAAAARYAPGRPQLDAISHRALSDAPPPALPAVTEPSRDSARPGGNDLHTAETMLWAALSYAGPEGAAVGELMAACGMGRSWVYARLAELAQAGRAVQVSRGMWRAAPPGGGNS